MREYAIGEVAEILGVKQHVLRYWEQEIPLVTPAKDNFGRRVYSGRDLQILLRVRYLVHEAGHTVRGAADRILNELTGAGAGHKARLQAVRDQLLPLLADVSAASVDRALFSPPRDWNDQELLFRGMEQSSPRERYAVVRALEQMGRSNYEQLREYLLNHLRSTRTPIQGQDSKIPIRLRSEAPYTAHQVIEDELYRGGQAIFTPELRLSRFESWENFGEEKRLFEQWSELLRAAEYEYGRPVFWFLPVHVSRQDSIERLFAARANFGMAPGRVSFVPVQDIPVLTEDGLLIPAEGKRIPACFYDPQTAGMLLLGNGILRERVTRLENDRVWIFSLLQPPEQLFDIGLAALQKHEGAELCIEAERLAEGRYSPTGKMVLLPTLLHRPSGPLPLRVRFDSPLHSKGAHTDMSKRTARLGLRVIDLYHWSENSVVAAQGE